MPELSSESFARQKALIKDPIDRLKHDRHAELLFSAIEHFIKIYQSHHDKEKLFGYVEEHLRKQKITNFPYHDHPIPSTALTPLKNALLTLNQDQLDQLDDALFGYHAFESVSKQKTFKNGLEIWQNKYPLRRRSGRLYSAMPEDQPLTPAASLKHYYQTLLTDLQHYHSLQKDDLSSCYEKIHSLCSNLIVLEHLHYLDSQFQTPNLSLNEKIALIQLTHDACLSYFNAPLEGSTLSHEDKQDLKVSFSQLMRLIFSQYLHDHHFSIFNSEPAEHLRQALITCCIEMQDRTSPKNKHGKTKKRTSTYNGKKHSNFIQCQEAIEVAIQTFQQQDLASTGVFFYQEDNTNPDFVVTFIQQHWRHHQHSQHFQVLLHRYWPSFYNSLQPLWELATRETDERFNHTACTHLYNFLLPVIENIHRIALVLDCIQEALTLPMTSDVERAGLREIKDLIQLKIDQKFALIENDLSDELLRFFGHTEDPLSLRQKWYTMPPQEIQLEGAQSIQAIRTILLDCSGEKRQALMTEIIDQYKDDTNKDRTDKRAACQGMLQVIESSIPTAEHIADICWRYTQDQEGIMSSVRYIPNIKQEEALRSAVVPGCFGPHDLTKGQRVFKQGIDRLQPPAGELWKTARASRQIITTASNKSDSGYENDSDSETEIEGRLTAIPKAPSYPPPAPPEDPPRITSISQGGIIVAPQHYLDGTELAAEEPTPKERVIVDPPQELHGTRLAAEEPRMISHHDATFMPPPPPPPPPKNKVEEKANLSVEKISSSMTAPHRTFTPPPPPPKKNEVATIDGSSKTLMGVKEGELLRGPEFVALLRKGAEQLKSPGEKSPSAPQENSKDRSSIFASLTEQITRRRTRIVGEEDQPLLSEEERTSTGSWEDSLKTKQQLSLKR